MAEKYDYDAIIIGAGIGGLVCGCYLAKAGMKVLIVEKNAKPGGYCTSFKRGEFYFDACVHSLGSLREGGNIRMIIKELDLEKRLDIKRYDPSDVIIAPDVKIHFWNNLDKTIQEIQDNFPGEADKVREFFNYINNCKGVSFIPLKNITFRVLLDRYFKDERLKAILSFPVLGNAGLPAKKISALTGTLIYKEFLFDGGYYPGDSMQVFPDTLVERFKEFGGELIYSSLAKSIKTENKKAVGVEIVKKGLLTAKYIISNADATQTFLDLIGEKNVSNDIISKLKDLEPSLSMFILYLGTSGNFYIDENLRSNANIWFLPDYDIDKLYDLAVEGDLDNLNCFLVRLLSDKKSFIVLVFAPFKNKSYWDDHKNKFIDVFIKKVDGVIPNLSSHIVFKDAATPHTLYKWTLNYKGASYGWAGMPSQLAVSGFTQKTCLENLYLTGHWTTLVQGVAGVAYIGRDTAQKILNKII